MVFDKFDLLAWLVCAPLFCSGSGNCCAHNSQTIKAAFCFLDFYFSIYTENAEWMHSPLYKSADLFFTFEFGGGNGIVSYLLCCNIPPEPLPFCIYLLYLYSANYFLTHFFYVLLVKNFFLKAQILFLKIFFLIQQVYLIGWLDGLSSFQNFNHCSVNWKRFIWVHGISFLFFLYFIPPHNITNTFWWFCHPIVFWIGNNLVFA